MEELQNISQNGELWKPIPNTNNMYFISTHGRGFSRYNNKLMKYQSRDKRYLYLRYLDSNGKQCYTAVHRLVAKAFIELPTDKAHLNVDELEVNHINGNKHDNYVGNLEWVSHFENLRHAYVTGLIPRQLKPILCITLNKVYSSMSDASRELGISRQNIWKVCNGKAKSCKGHTFRYLEEVE